MRTVTDLIRTDTIASTLAVLLPGAYGIPEDFQREGFISALRERDLPVDVVLADMNLECITDGSALALLRNTIIRPARDAGYRTIWLIGISIGGFMAMAYVDRHPGEIDGICLIAPYPGNRMITNEISASGGILGWSPSLIPEEDHERRVWHWLKNHAACPTTVHIGYGENDRFAAAHSAMSAALPPERVHALPGDHDWPTWRDIWIRFLDTGVIAQPDEREHPR